MGQQAIGVALGKQRVQHLLSMLLSLLPHRCGTPQLGDPGSHAVADQSRQSARQQVLYHQVAWEGCQLPCCWTSWRGGGQKSAYAADPFHETCPHRFQFKARYGVPGRTKRQHGTSSTWNTAGCVL